MHSRLEKTKFENMKFKILKNKFLKLNPLCERTDDNFILLIGLRYYSTPQGKKSKLMAKSKLYESSWPLTFSYNIEMFDQAIPNRKRIRDLHQNL